jgi:plasmid segregation protein ParM
MIRAIDVGYGAVKGVCEVREIEYPSAVGSFRPVRFTTGMEKQEIKDRLCVEFEGKRYFIGDIAYKQSSPRATMNSERFTSQEGLALMMSALILLSNSQYETVNLITGLPVNEYANLKDSYKNALLGKHYIQLIKPDGTEGEFYTFNIENVKILPQPMGTIFDKVLGLQGELENKLLASGKIAVLDIGKYTVDLVLTDSLQFVDKSSVGFNDIGMFDAYKELSIELKNCGYDIPADSLEPYIHNGKHLNGLDLLKEQVFSALSEKIISRVYNTWTDLWDLDQIFITGGGSLILGGHLMKHLDANKVIICDKPTLTNCRGYFKFANMVLTQ